MHIRNYLCALAFAAVVAAFGLAGPANALVLNLVDSKSVTSPFGLLYDGSNVWYSVGTSGSTIYQINQTAAGMPNTGSSIVTGSGGERAWDGSHYVTAASNRSLLLTNPDGTSAGTIAPLDGGISGLSLIDGLDFDHGEIWYSPDVGNIYRLDGTGAFTGSLNPVVSGGGGFSGVERVDVGLNSFLIAVNDASNPRTLCQISLLGVFNAGSDCVTLANDRYEGLAFDGRYLYAADYYGHRIDKIDLLNDGGGSIFDPGGGPNGSAVPEPSTLALLGLSLAALGFVRRRRHI